MVQFLEKYKGVLIGFVVGFLVCLAIWLLNTNHELKKEIIEVEKPVVTVKTETRIDTVTITKTVPKPEYITETIIRVDTIENETTIPIVQRQYSTLIDTDTVKGEINATVSGFQPVLDTLSYNLNIFPRTETITITEQITKYKQKKINFGVFVGPSYNTISKKFDLSVGCGIVFTPF